LLNGCCYGNVACPDCPALHFPLSAPPRYHLVAKGYQTAAGFTLKESERLAIAQVEPGSAAEQAGLKPGDVIRQINGNKVANDDVLASYLGQEEWPRGKNDLTLTIQRPDGGGGPAVAKEITLPAFAPKTIGLHPTQVYETISMGLLLAVMLLYWPFRRRDGELMVIFMLGYAVHRFLNEMLRDDTAPVFAGMTLSENGSILVFIAGLALLGWLLCRPRQYRLSGDPIVQSEKGVVQPAAVPSRA